MSITSEIRIITSPETLPLRHQVLRPDRPVAESIYDNDNYPHAQHWGMFVQDTLIAIASIYQEPLPESVQLAASHSNSSNAHSHRHPWRLRGMAVNPAFQGQGYGAKLLGRCLQSVAEHEGSLLWCNARKSAVPFYHASGFEILGNEFDIPGIGPHYVMQHRLPL